MVGLCSDLGLKPFGGLLTLWLVYSDTLRKLCWKIYNKPARNTPSTKPSNTHPTPSPTTPLTVPFSFFPFFSLFFLSSHQSTHTLFTFHLLPHAPVCSTLGSKTWQEWQNLNRKSVVKKSIFQTRKNSLRKSILYTVCLKSSSY